MARKSIIKDICDMFESDNTAKSPTFTKYCDLEQVLNINDSQERDKIMNKTIITNDTKDCQSTTSSTKNDYHLETIKDRISKLNVETLPSKTSNINPSNRPKSNTVSRRSGTPKDLGINNGKFKKNNTLPVRRPKVGRLNLSNFGNISGEFKSQSPSPTTPKSPRRFNNFPNRMSLTKTPLDKRNSKSIPKLASPTVKAESPKLEPPKRNSRHASVLPEIPAKPKYINKIKPHPRLSVKSKNDLQDKIKKFNNLTSAANDANVYENVNLNNSKTDLYDLVVNPNQNRPKSKHPKLAVSPRIKPDTENVSYDIIRNPNNKPNLKPVPKSPVPPETYDLVQKSVLLNNLKPVKALPEQDQEEHVYQEIVDPPSKTNKHKRVENSKSSKNIKNFKAMSKDHSLEGDGYVVVVDEAKTPSSDDSSDEDLATEYDVIENLNVTKITVERRYKVPNNEEENSTFNVKRETYYDHNLNPRIEFISRQVQKRDEGGQLSGNRYNKKSAMIIQELLQTELAYFKGLLKVYEDYIIYFRESSNLSSHNINKIFGNLEDIYKLQIDFYGELTGCHNNIDTIAETFLKNKQLFELYEKYILNKQVSLKCTSGECLQAIQERDKELGNPLNLESYLLTPFQRLIRYRMLLKTLHETLQSENNTNTKLESAINYLEQVIEGTNLQVKLMQDIENCPVDLTKRGKLLMVDECFMKHNGKKYCATVILFEDIIIFTRKNETQKYIYKGSINLVDLYIRSITEEETSFQLQNFTQYKVKHDNKYVYDLEVGSAKAKQDWVSKIQTLLWNQFAAHKRS